MYDPPRPCKGRVDADARCEAASCGSPLCVLRGEPAAGVPDDRDRPDLDALCQAPSPLLREKFIALAHHSTMKTAKLAWRILIAYMIDYNPYTECLLRTWGYQTGGTAA